VGPATTPYSGNGTATSTWAMKCAESGCLWPARVSLENCATEEVGRVDKCLGSTAREFRCSFAPEPAASARARKRLTPILTAWGLSSRQSHDALLVANELVANAVDHARTPLELLVSFTGASVLIKVRDGSVVEPRLQAFDRTAPRGRGLQFVDALARRWSWQAEAHGKVVWAEMAIS
jgi:anti-sigma regulatory factor (Ser/Thr protein kinase)